MSNVVLVRCSGCFKRYPVNLKKHKDRDTRFCPFCKTPHKIKRRFKFLPNLNWFHQKAEQAYQRTRIKEMRRQEPKEPKQPKQPFAIPTQIPESLLALSILVRQREMELEEEQRQKREKSNS